MEHCTPISAENRNKLAKSRDFIKDYISFENNRKQLFLSLKEFDYFLVDSALEHENSSLPNYQFFEDASLRANLRALSFLNSLTGLKDKFPKFKSLAGQSDPRKLFESEWKKSRDSSSAFHFCWIFRDVAQHHKHPINFVSLGTEWDEDRRYRESTVAVYGRTRDLEGKREVKLHEIEQFLNQFGEQVDLSLIFRETAHEVSRISKAIRCLLEEPMKENIEIYRSFLDMYPSNGHENRVLWLEFETGEIVGRDFQIFDEFARRAERLNKELLLTNQHYHFTSNRSRGHRQQ